MPPLTVENDHNVYVLGAGFSASAGIPLVRDFLERMRDSLEWLASQNRSSDVTAVESVLDFRLRAASAAYRTTIDLENVEELFSLASATGASGLHSKMQQAIAATLDFCSATSATIGQRTKAVILRTASPLHQTLSSQHWPRVSATHLGYVPEVVALGVPDYQALLGGLLGNLSSPSTDRKNTFISFNYDLLVEQALAAGGAKIDYGIPAKRFTVHAPWIQPGGVPLLKLHGSVNWAFPGTRGKRMTGYAHYADVLSAGVTPVLVPPTWRKEFVPQLSDVWNAALQAIQTATRIIVIGFSMPPADQHFRYLLSAGLRENISLRRILFVDVATGPVQKRALQILRPELVKRGTLEFIGTGATALLSASNLNRLGRSLASDTDISA